MTHSDHVLVVCYDVEFSVDSFQVFKIIIIRIKTDFKVQIGAI